jgi:hypothetical protein
MPTLCSRSSSHRRFPFDKGAFWILDQRLDVFDAPRRNPRPKLHRPRKSARFDSCPPRRTAHRDRSRGSENPRQPDESRFRERCGEGARNGVLHENRLGCLRRLDLVGQMPGTTPKDFQVDFCGHAGRGGWTMEPITRKDNMARRMVSFFFSSTCLFSYDAPSCIPPIPDQSHTSDRSMPHPSRRLWLSRPN